jgi:hypothetical protein
LIDVKRYTAADLSAWNDFIDSAKNATFLFKREYVDYNQHRFRDHSLLIYIDDKLSGLLIANESGDRIESHGGLTYGGLILEPSVKLELVLRFFFHLLKYYHSNGFKTLLYKCLPSYLATLPSNEELYALFLLNANVVRRETSMVIDKTKPFSMKRVPKNSLQVNLSPDPEKFWNEVLIPNLGERYGAEPVHNVSEIRLLMNRFPDNIHLFEIYSDQKLVGGTVVYSTSTTAHLQYTSVNLEGRKLRAVDVLVNHILKNFYSNKSYFSFGTSNTNEGRGLNRGLIEWKEGFDARTFIHDFYEISIAEYNLLNDYE